MKAVVGLGLTTMLTLLLLTGAIGLIEFTLLLVPVLFLFALLLLQQPRGQSSKKPR